MKKLYHKRPFKGILFLQFVAGIFHFIADLIRFVFHFFHGLTTRTFLSAVT